MLAAANGLPYSQGYPSPPERVSCGVLFSANTAFHGGVVLLSISHHTGHWPTDVRLRRYGDSFDT